MQQIWVKVIDRDEIEQIITERAFNIGISYDTQAYKLLYQCDEAGNEIPGNPNLKPQYRNQPKAENPAVAAETVVLREPVKIQPEETVKLEAPDLINQAIPEENVSRETIVEPVQPKKRGRKPKLQTA